MLGDSCDVSKKFWRQLYGQGKISMGLSLPWTTTTMGQTDS